MVFFPFFPGKKCFLTEAKNTLVSKLIGIKKGCFLGGLFDSYKVILRHLFIIISLYYIKPLLSF